MSKSLLASIVLVAGLAAGAVAQPKAAPKMQILSFTGQIQIKVGNEVIGVVAGGKIPDIPAGAEVIVVTGEAVLQAGDTVVKADAGSSFAFTASDAGAVQIAATGDKSVAVTVGGAEAVVSKGDKIEVAVAAPGKAEVKVVTGNVEVNVGGQTQALAAGQTIAAPTTPPPAPVQTAQQTQQQQQKTPAEPTAETTAEAPLDFGSLPPAPPPPNPLQDTQTVSPSSP